MKKRNVYAEIKKLSDNRLNIYIFDDVNKKCMFFSTHKLKTATYETGNYTQTSSKYPNLIIFCTIDKLK